MSSRALPLLHLSVVMSVAALGARANAQIGWGVQDASVSTGGVALSWNEPDSNRAYAVETRRALGEGDWAYARPVDQWPIADTNWIGADTNASGFYRINAVQRGVLLASAFVGSYSSNDVDDLFFAFDIPLTASYGISIYRLTYETFDHRGQAAVSAGLLVVPQDVVTAPLLSYQHATIFLSEDAPSVPGSLEVLAGIIFASAGYATTQPDYLGLGTNSPPLHPFLHARSEATAAVDLLRVGRAFINANLALTLTDQLFLIGYSQGGHATLALQRELETHHTNEFTIAAAAPMAGPYDLSGAMTDIIGTDAEYGSPSYLAYLIFGYDGVYDLFGDPFEVFVSPYHTNLPPLLDGTHSGSEIDEEMPAVPSDALQPAYLDAFTNDVNHPLRVALRANDLWNWAPRSPTHLYHCAGDTVVSIANAQVATNHFAINGSTNVTLIDPSPLSDHTDCAAPAVLAAKTWFDTIKTP